MNDKLNGEHGFDVDKQSLDVVTGDHPMLNTLAVNPTPWNICPRARIEQTLTTTRVTDRRFDATNARRTWLLSSSGIQTGADQHGSFT